MPDNIVPISRIKSYITCKKAGQAVKICRSQIPILPNFAITDYTSQGKTRPINLVDIADCRTSMACYVALSRGISAEKTAILRPFSSKKLTDRISGYLRQEFRELELLDEITNLIYHGNSKYLTKYTTRSTVLTHYRNFKGKDYCPSTVETPLKWTKDDPMIDIVESSIINYWDTKHTQEKTTKKKHPIVGFVSAQGSKAIDSKK